MNVTERYAFLKSVGGLLDGTLDAAGQSLLARRMESDTEACELYWQFIAFDVDLRWSLSARLQRNLVNQVPPASIAEGLPSFPATELLTPARPHFADGRSPRMSRALVWSVSACAVLFALYFVGISWDMLGRRMGSAARDAEVVHRVPAVSSDVLPGGEVATIRNQVDVQWAAGMPLRLTTVAAQGSSIQRGESLSLMSGMIEVQLRQGTTVMVQGPADWTIDDDNAATLTKGKLLARVPPQAVGFTVTTPTARYVDLGTEFGVAVGDDASSYMRVFRGKVLGDTRAIAGADATVASSVVVRAGQAIQSVAGAALQVLPAIDEDGQFASLRGMMSKPRVNLNQEHVLAHWRFENIAPATNLGVTQISTVTDASGQGNHLDYWPGNLGDYPSSQKVPPPEMFNLGYDGGERSFHAGALDPSRYGVLFHDSRRLGDVFAFSGDFTIEGYFCLNGDQSTVGPMTLLFKDRYTPQWEISANEPQPGALAMVVWSADEGRHVCSVGGVEDTASPLNFVDGQWCYFAARVARETGEVSLLVAREDGATASHKISLPPGFTFRTEAGCPEHNLFLARREHVLPNKQQFRGLIDEVRISRQWLADKSLLYPVVDDLGKRN